MNNIKVELESIYSIIKDLIEEIKNHITVIKFYGQDDDIIYYTIKQYYRISNLNKIRIQKLKKKLLNKEVRTYSDEYIFNKRIDKTLPLFIILLNNDSNSFYFKYDEENEIIGIKYRYGSCTLFQYIYFGKKLEEFLTEKTTILLHEHELKNLFLQTMISSFPIIFSIYEARDKLLKTDIKKEYLLDEIVKQVALKGYFINFTRRNDNYVMQIQH